MNTAIATPKGPETRFGLREGHKFPVRLAVRQSASTPVMTVHGVSKNLTSSGMRIRVSSKVIVGARCQVNFLHVGGRVRPCTVNGTVRNAIRVRASDGEFEIGVEFDRPVEIKQPGKL